MEEEYFDKSLKVMDPRMGSIVRKNEHAERPADGHDGFIMLPLFAYIKSAQ